MVRFFRLSGIRGNHFFEGVPGTVRHDMKSQSFQHLWHKIVLLKYIPIQFQF
jgi:hypothetical protein